MKKKLIAVAAPSPLWAAAQSSVTLYGIADLGIRHTSGLSASNAAATGSLNALTSGVNNTSRLGFRGSEDLGGGLKASFNLETGLNLDQGVQANSTKFFDRASWVGLGGGWGTLSAGRQTTTLVEAVSPVDPVGMRFAAFNPNIATAALSAHGLGIEYGSAGLTTGSYRLDNSLKYAGQFGPVAVRAMYAFGEVAGNTSQRSSTGAGAIYRQGALTVSGAYQTFRTATGLDLDAATVGAAYQWGSVRLAANTGRNRAETSATATTRQAVHSAGATWAATSTIDLTAALYRVERERTAVADDGYSRVIPFAEYKLSRRTKVYAEADTTRWQGGYRGTGNSRRGSGGTLGVMHTF